MNKNTNDLEALVMKIKKLNKNMGLRLNIKKNKVKKTNTAASLTIYNKDIKTLSSMFQDQIKRVIESTFKKYTTDFNLIEWR